MNEAQLAHERFRPRVTGRVHQMQYSFLFFPIIVGVVV
jgi:hypothetical protein